MPPRRLLASLLALAALAAVPAAALAADEDGCNETTAFADRPFLADGCAVAVLAISPNPLAPGETASLSAAGSVGPEGRADEIDYYAWDFGDGATAETVGQAISHLYPDRGRYLVQLTTLTADDRQIATAFMEAVVDIPPVAALDGPDGPYVRPGDVVEFSAVGSSAMAGGSVAAYRWDWGDGSPVEETAGPVATHVFAREAASRSVTVRAVDDLDVASDPVSVAIVVHNELPSVAVSADPATVDVGQALILSATASDADGTIAQYRWDRDGDGVYETTTGTTPTVSAGGFANPGSIVLGVKVFDDSGGTRTASVTITVVGDAGGGGGATGGGGSGGDGDGDDGSDRRSGGRGTRSGGSTGDDGDSTAGAQFSASLGGAAIQRLGGVLRRGIGVQASANRLARGTLTLLLAARDARRLGLSNRQIGRLRLTVRPDRTAMASISLSRKAARALRTSRPATLRVVVRGTLTAAGERTKLARLVLVRR